MEFIKYFTNPQFDNAKFADMLRLKMNVRAKAVEDGVILDRDAFNAMSAALMPNWAWLNKQSINSPLHTRPADPTEWPDLAHAYRYLLAIVFDDKDACQLEQRTGLSTSTDRQIWLLAIGVKRTASMAWQSLITTLAKSCTWQTKT